MEIVKQFWRVGYWPDLSRGAVEMQVVCEVIFALGLGSLG